MSVTMQGMHGATVDRTGEQYGAWVALRPGTRPSRGYSHGLYWVCRAACCGREREICGSNLAKLRAQGSALCLDCHCASRPVDGQCKDCGGPVERAQGTRGRPSWRCPPCKLDHKRKTERDSKRRTRAGLPRESSGQLDPAREARIRHYQAQVEALTKRGRAS